MCLVVGGLERDHLLRLVLIPGKEGDIHFTMYYVGIGLEKNISCDTKEGI